jgi:dipeptidase E
MRNIFLSGGGNPEQSFIFDEAYISFLKQKKILYIPLALSLDALGYESCNDWIVSTLSNHSQEFIDISMCLDVEKITKDYLFQFDSVYVGGGNTYQLQKIFKQNSFDKILIDYIDNGGIYYGGSAGAIITGHRIDCSDDEKVSYTQNSLGLSFFGNLSFCCHYKDNQEDEAASFSQRYHVPLIALPEESGIFISENDFVVLGLKNATFFDAEGKKSPLYLGHPGRLTSLLQS